MLSVSHSLYVWMNALFDVHYSNYSLNHTSLLFVSSKCTCYQCCSSSNRRDCALHMLQISHAELHVCILRFFLNKINDLSRNVLNQIFSVGIYLLTVFFCGWNPSRKYHKS